MDRNRPLIGISAYEVPRRFAHWRDVRSVMVPAAYTRVGRRGRAGCRSSIPPDGGRRPSCWTCSTGIVFTGGSDIDPALYGQQAARRDAPASTPTATAPSWR